MIAPAFIIRESMIHSPDSSSGTGGMNDDPSVSAEHNSTRQHSTLSQRALDKFLDHLSLDREEAGRKREALRTRLISFFEWRGCNLPDLRADQTLDRVIIKIDEGHVISNLLPYSLEVARRIAKEDWRERKRMHMLDDDVSHIPHPSVPDPLSKLESEEPDPRLICFDRCLESLSANSRDLILGYYKEDGRAKIEWRKQLAEELGIPLNALRIRTHRIRNILEQCIENCLAQFARREY